MAPTIGRLALDNGFHGSIPEDWVAPPPGSSAIIRFALASYTAVLLPVILYYIYRT